jgi:hypothetical protein
MEGNREVNLMWGSGRRNESVFAGVPPAAELGDGNVG